MVKKFEFAKTNTEEENKESRQVRILKIINGSIIEAKIPQVSQLLHKELHKQKSIDTRGESEKYEDAREDVCSSFGVPEDEQHIFIEKEKSGSQRAFRAFVVFIDRKKINQETGLQESFYGEGRSAHAQLLSSIMKKMQDYGIKDVNIDAWVNDTERVSPEFTLADIPNDPEIKNGPRWLFFKGFLLENEDEIKRLPETLQYEIMNDFLVQKDKSEKIGDESGEITDEKMRWFLTGSNIPSSHHEN